MKIKVRKMEQTQKQAKNKHLVRKDDWQNVETIGLKARGSKEPIEEEDARTNEVMSEKGNLDSLKRTCITL